jgi:hypothetical protein
VVGAALVGVGAEATSAEKGTVSKRNHDNRGGVSSVGLPDVQVLLSGPGVEISAALLSGVSKLQPLC